MELAEYRIYSWTLGFELALEKCYSENMELQQLFSTFTVRMAASVYFYRQVNKCNIKN